MGARNQPRTPRRAEFPQTSPARKPPDLAANRAWRPTGAFPRALRMQSFYIGRALGRLGCPARTWIYVGRPTWIGSHARARGEPQRSREGTRRAPAPARVRCAKPSPAHTPLTELAPARSERRASVRDVFARDRVASVADLALGGGSCRLSCGHLHGAQADRADGFRGGRALR
jgi:hypothetical protein